MDSEQETYWDRTVDVSYAEILFANSAVEKHVGYRLWQTGIEIGKSLCLDATSRILDLGCGDGALANNVLAKHFHSVDGYDISSAGIERANALAANSNIKFYHRDITKLNFSELPQYDGAYLWGILHHVKSATPAILQGLRKVTKRVVVLEPNGNNLIRKILEKTPTYKAAGEDSFRTRGLEKLFQQAGFKVVTWKRVNIFANFTPKFLVNLLKPLEPIIEKTPLLRAVCTANMWGLIANE